MSPSSPQNQKQANLSFVYNWAFMHKAIKE